MASIRPTSTHDRAKGRAGDSDSSKEVVYLRVRTAVQGCVRLCKGVYIIGRGCSMTAAIGCGSADPAL